jgi:hypothetical protein
VAGLPVIVRESAGILTAVARWTARELVRRTVDDDRRAAEARFLSYFPTP